MSLESMSIFILIYIMWYNGIALLLRIWPGTQIRQELGAGQQVHVMGLNFKWSKKLTGINLKYGGH